MRLFRDRDPLTHCPDHGPLRNQTRCRFCSYDPLFLPHVSSERGLPRALPDESRGAFYSDLPENIGQELSYVSEAV